MTIKDNNPHSENALQLVTTSNLVPQEVKRASRQLALAGRISTQLVLNDERRRWVTLLININPDDAVKFLSRRAPISQDLLGHYQNFWDWEELSNNKAIPWSLKLLEKFENYWVWQDWDEPIGLSNNDSLPWSLELLERFKNRWEWGNFHPTLEARGVSTLKTLPWSFDLLEQFKDRWDWEHLSNNNTIPWSIELLESFEDRWVWQSNFERKGNHERYGLSENRALPWSIKLLERFENHWDWQSLSANESLPWSIELMARFKERWDWSALSAHNFLPWADLLRLFDLTTYYFGRQIPECYWLKWLDNSSIPQKLLEKYKEQWEWSIWSESKMRDTLLDHGLDENQYFKWLDRYAEDKWNWEELSQITYLVFESDSLPWPISLLVGRDEDSYKYREELETNLLLGISLSESISWSVELIERIDKHFDEERYDDDWEWEDSWKQQLFWDNQKKIWERLSHNKSLPWSQELTERFTHLWNLWEKKPVVWTVERLECIEEDWDWDRKYVEYREQMWNQGYTVEAKDSWIWRRLSWEESLPWSVELLEHFKDRWDWGSLSWNKSLPWSAELIERFKDRWNWSYLLQNTYLPELPLTGQDIEEIMQNVANIE